MNHPELTGHSWRRPEAVPVLGTTLWPRTRSVYHSGQLASVQTQSHITWPHLHRWPECSLAWCHDVWSAASNAISLLLPLLKSFNFSQCCCQELETQGWGQGQGVKLHGQGQGLENWSSRRSRTRTFLEDNNTVKQWRVSNKRPGLLEIQSCQSTCHTLVTS